MLQGSGFAGPPTPETSFVARNARKSGVPAPAFARALRHRSRIWVRSAAAGALVR